MTRRDQRIWIGDFDPRIFRPPSGGRPQTARPQPSQQRLSLLEDRGRLSILELGCGRGGDRKRLVERGHRYVGLDISDSRADVRADAHRLPFRDAAFDAVLTVASLQYMLRPDLVFAECHRVLRNGGTITGSAPFLEPWQWGGYVHLSPGGLIVLLEGAGFSVKHVWPGWPGWAAFNCTALAPLSSAQEWITSLQGILLRTWWRFSHRRLTAQPAPSMRALQVTAAVNFHGVKTPSDRPARPAT